ncbi:MAG: TetR/AcrR family transcriptional regulator [Chloroflexota bacterium]|nr:TetR/AcrR family transcriptional regulator [Chloroflexota bacterium]
MPKPNVSEERKQTILFAAAQVFTAQGLSIARMDDVAAAAGISKGTVYLYYPSKDKLIEALLHRLFEPLEAALVRLNESDAPIRERLMVYAQDNLLAFDTARALHPLILELFALSRRQDFAGQLFGTYFLRYRDNLRDILRAAAQRGELSLAVFGASEEQASLSFMALLEGILILAMMNPGLLSLQQDGTVAVQSWLRLLDA